MPDDTKRMFTAIYLPSPVKADLVPLQIPHDKIKWAKPMLLHITVNFLGEVNATDIDKAKKILEETVKELNKFDLRLTHITLENGYMIWVVVEDLSGSLSELQDELASKFRQSRVGQIDKRTYRPHVLLGKFQNKYGNRLSDNPDLFETLENFKNKTFTIEHITLYESVLDPAGATHTPHGYFRFGKAGPEPEARSGEIKTGDIFSE